MSEHAHAHDSHGHDDAQAAPHHDHRKDYFKIFWVLLVLTIVEVGITYIKMDRRALAALMVGLACTKAAFVGLYYMHLRYEKRSLLWLAALPFPLAGFYAAGLMLDAQGLLRAVTAPFVR